MFYKLAILTGCGLQLLNELLADKSVGEVDVALEKCSKQAFVRVIEMIGKFVEPRVNLDLPAERGWFHVDHTASRDLQG